MITKISQEPAKAPKTAEDVRIMTLIWSMADTTWRMFTPPALFVPAGIWADLAWGTKPWLTMLSAACGLAVSVALVRRQLGDSQ